MNPSQYTVIHNTLEDGEEGAPSLECQFEEALEREYALIIIEPVGLGNDSIRWIKVGNFLHKMAVIASITTLTTTPFMPTRIALFTTVPLGLLSVSCTILYCVSWQSDPCCKYQVDYHGKELTHIPSHDIYSPSPVVLVRRNDKYRKILHNTLSAVVIGYFGWTLFKHFHYFR